MIVMGKLKRKLLPIVAVIGIGAGFLVGGPAGALTMASSGYMGYKLGKKNASGKEVAKEMATFALITGANVMVDKVQPDWIKAVKKK